MGQQGVQKLRESATKRHKLKDIKNRDVTDRILHEAFNESLKCHKSCYAWFTDKGKIARLESKSPHAVSSCSASSHMSQLRSSTKPLLWELCMFCQTESKRETLRSVQTLETSTNIIEGAKFDQKLCPALSGCSDLIAAEAKYHLLCYTSFKRKISKTRDTAQGINIAMAWLTEELELNAHNGHIVELAEVWKRYNTLTEESGEDVPQSFISRRTSFTDKLKSILKDVYEFHVL